MHRYIRRSFMVGCRSFKGQKTQENIVWTLPKPTQSLETDIVIDGNSDERLKQVNIVYEAEIAPVYDAGLMATEVKQVGIAELHPDIWSVNVDQNLIHQALEWQNSYKTVDMSFEQSRLEVGHKRYSKPWQGSGEGWERVRDKTGPMFKGGAFTDEPRRPFISNFHMIERTVRVKALIACLTHLQNDLIIVQDIRLCNLPKISRALNTKNEEQLSYIVLHENTDYPPALEDWIRGKKYYNLFPLEGLNVKSLLKYDKVIMDLTSLEKLEARLLFEISRYDFLESHSEPEHPMLNRFWSDVMGKWKDEKFNLGGYKSGHHRFYKDWPSQF